MRTYILLIFLCNIILDAKAGKGKIKVNAIDLSFDAGRMSSDGSRDESLFKYLTYGFESYRFNNMNPRASRHTNGERIRRFTMDAIIISKSNSNWNTKFRPEFRIGISLMNSNNVLKEMSYYPSNNFFSSISLNYKMRSEQFHAGYFIRFRTMFKRFDVFSGITAGTGIYNMEAVQKDYVYGKMVIGRLKETGNMPSSNINSVQKFTTIVYNSDINTGIEYTYSGRLSFYTGIKGGLFYSQKLANKYMQTGFSALFGIRYILKKINRLPYGMPCQIKIVR